MQLEDMILVSVDDHLVEPPSMSDFFMDHFPAKYRDQVPTVITKDDGTDVWLVQGHEVASFGLNAVAGRVSTEWGMDPGNFGEVRAGTYDVHERVRDMNINGVLGSMCFSSWPGLGGQYFLQSGDSELAACMIRAYNDWHIEEWAGAAPGRFIPLALSGFMLGAEWMAGEIRRVAEKGCHAISFHSEVHRFGMPDHHGDEWDPAWQACEDTDSVMVFHFGGAPNFMPRSPFDVLIHTMPFNTGVFCSELLWSPVLRKFPTVKFALAEGGIGWIPYWLERADYVYQRHSPWTLQDFGDELPSQVFKSRVLTCFIDDVTGLKLRHDIGVENIAWECDYPHSDCTWPHAPEDIWKSLQAVEVPDNEIDMITWENACRFYNFDPFEHRTREECTVGALARTVTRRRHHAQELRQACVAVPGAGSIGA